MIYSDIYELIDDIKNNSINKNTPYLSIDKSFSTNDKYYLDLPSLKINNRVFKYIMLAINNNLDFAKRLKRLNFRDNNILELAPETFINLENLEVLDLRNNRIVGLDKNSFIGLNSLRYINLSNNENIKHFPINLFKNMNNLEVLSLGNIGLDNSSIDSRRSIESIFTSCLYNLEDLDLSDNKLQNLDYNPCGIFKLKFLDLSNCEIVYIKIGFFNNMSELEMLDLSHNNLNNNIADSGDVNYNTPMVNNNHSYSIKDIFIGLESIINIDLSHNSLFSIPNIRFSLKDNHSKLLELDVSNNKINNISQDFINNNYKLIKFSVGQNFLSRLPLLNKLSNLQYLDLSNNKLSFVNSDFNDYNSLSSLFNLKYLSLKANEIFKLDYCMFKDLINLETLDLSYNKLNILELSIFNNNCKLKEFILKSNQSSGTRDSIFITNSNMLTIKSIEEIFLSNNKISKISKDLLVFAKYSKLLDLSDNCIEVLDVPATNNSMRRTEHLLNKEILMLDNLAKIDLSNNLIKNISSGFFKLTPNIESIILNENKIHNIEPFSFNLNCKLKSLHLHLNKLECISRNVFTENNNIESLFLRNNKIKDLKWLSDNNFSSVKYLDLGVNYIEHIYDGTFELLNKLESLLLVKNEISHIPKNAFNNNICLRKIDLDVNNLNEIPIILNSNISDLGLSNNGITNLRGLELYPNLQKVNLSFNEIEDIPYDLNIHNLEEIYLDSNKIKFIPVKFPGYKLKKISMNKTLASSLPSYSFCNLENLEEVYLLNNKFSNISLYNLNKDLSWPINGSNSLSHLSLWIHNEYIDYNCPENHNSIVREGYISDLSYITDNNITEANSDYIEKIKKILFDIRSNFFITRNNYENKYSYDEFFRDLNVLSLSDEILLFEIKYLKNKSDHSIGLASKYSINSIPINVELIADKYLEYKSLYYQLSDKCYLLTKEPFLLHKIIVENLVDNDEMKLCAEIEKFLSYMDSANNNGAYYLLLNKYKNYILEKRDEIYNSFFDFINLSGFSGKVVLDKINNALTNNSLLNLGVINSDIREFATSGEQNLISINLVAVEKFFNYNHKSINSILINRLLKNININLNNYNKNYGIFKLILPHCLNELDFNVNNSNIIIEYENYNLDLKNKRSRTEKTELTISHNNYLVSNQANNISNNSELDLISNSSIVSKKQKIS